MVKVVEKGEAGEAGKAQYIEFPFMVAVMAPYFYKLVNDTKMALHDTPDANQVEVMVFLFQFTRESVTPQDISLCFACLVKSLVPVISRIMMGHMRLPTCCDLSVWRRATSFQILTNRVGYLNRVVQSTYVEAWPCLL